jgi:hypothetical protein
MPPVPQIPAHLSTPAKFSENSKRSLSKLLPDMPSTTSSSDDAGVTEKVNQKEMAAAEVEVKVNAANAMVKTPSTVDRARLDEYYEIEVRGFSQMEFGS